MHLHARFTCGPPSFETGKGHDDGLPQTSISTEGRSRPLEDDSLLLRTPSVEESGSRASSSHVGQHKRPASSCKSVTHGPRTTTPRRTLSSFPTQIPSSPVANFNSFLSFCLELFALAWVANPCAVKEHHCRLKARHVASRQYSSLIGHILGVVP